MVNLTPVNTKRYVYYAKSVEELEEELQRLVVACEEAVLAKQEVRIELTISEKTS
jgi:hypothetical protein